MNKQNDRKHWDEVYKKEITEQNLWRSYPQTYNFIANKLISGVTLEIGCGLSPLAEKSIGYYGIDISTECIKLMCQLHPNQIFTCCDILKKKDFLQSKIFNPIKNVVAVNVIEHFTDEELDIFFENISQFKYGLFAVPNNVLPPSQEEEHHQMFTPESFENLLKKYYTSVEITEICDTWQYKGFSYMTPMIIAVVKK